MVALTFGIKALDHTHLPAFPLLHTHVFRLVPVAGCFVTILQYFFILFIFLNRSIILPEICLLLKPTSVFDRDFFLSNVLCILEIENRILLTSPQSDADKTAILAQNIYIQSLFE